MSINYSPAQPGGNTALASFEEIWPHADPVALERFTAKIHFDGPTAPHMETPCWIWTAKADAGRSGRGKQSYGRFWLGAAHVFAHRVAYEWATGEQLGKLQADHRCHVGLCIRPDHLRAVTNKENCENRAGAYRNSSTGIRGVRKYRHRFRVEVCHGGKRIHLGYFDTVEAAEAAVIAKRRELFTHNDLDR